MWSLAMRMMFLMFGGLAIAEALQHSKSSWATTEVRFADDLDFTGESRVSYYEDAAYTAPGRVVGEGEWAIGFKEEAYVAPTTSVDPTK